MAQSKPATLCSHLMPSGKLCRGVALRNERYCRSHIRNYRLLELDRAQTPPSNGSRWRFNAWTSPPFSSKSKAG